ncbi:hypothetical protein, partial, partial [Parasitella parasitica]
TTQRTVRKRLECLGISNKRILNVHFPTKGIVAFLVHKTYAVDVKSLLQNAKIQPVAFDPTHPSVICDPQFNDLSNAEKQNQAKIIYGNRITRFCSSMQPQHLGAAIINFFNSLPADDVYHLHDAFKTEYLHALARKQESIPS